jgi:F0F1-type ATP synthase assembly protein I
LGAAFFTVTVHNSWKGIGAYSTVGLELALSVLVGLFGGRWMSQKLHAGSWLTLVGLGFGIAAGARTVWRALQRANREALEEEARERKERDRFHDHEDR